MVIYVNNQYDSSGFVIIKFDSSGNNPQVIVTEMYSSLQGFTIDKFDKLYVGRGGGANTLTKYDSSGVLLLTISDDGINLPAGIEIDSSGYIYVANASSNNIENTDLYNVYHLSLKSKSAKDTEYGQMEYFQKVLLKKVF